ncbi:hypothetical protein AUJ77_02395 [Candidatus Nomurabacteria bacterium CG1_02_43_90]|uniref:GGDEF domain-containing protein n=1 Tax=Candidatus Nomurabacteria bacterium CG1_02_43_90 TaxID=1805281 RepID=A0A1J4V0G9_9BACT|nr:MAG: hypothetical protein AUJ77_02395 [Candidatus Nomurabacteria bacterium CG1_02_43_90]
MNKKTCEYQILATRLQVENLRLYRKLTELTEELQKARETDIMTGLANKKRLMREIEHHLGLYKRSGMHFSIVFIDIDNFKKENDKDHTRGDRLIIEFADFLSVCVRSSDIIARFGGDEFCILIPGTHHEAVSVCKKIEHQLSKFWFDKQGTLTYLCASWGVASTSEGIQGGVEELLQVADRRQIEQKRNKKK